MPRNLTELTVFVSGSSETDVERSALHQVITELSPMLERTHEITLRAIGWPEEIRPGVGTDPQAEINRQVSNVYDIYVGFLGARFGTATPRAGSGTEEEFEQAITKFRADSTSMRVLFYFKRSKVDPLALDITQLQKVRTFRDTLSSRGVLYRDFFSTTDFVQMVKDHLHSLIVEEWQNSAWTDLSLVESAQPNEKPPVGHVLGQELILITNGSQNGFAGAQGETELGMLDYMSAFHEATGPLTDALLQISRHTEQMTTEINAITAEMTGLLQAHELEHHVGGSRAQQQYVADAKKVVNRAAETMEEYADRLVADLERFRTYNRAVFVNLDLATAEPPASVETNRENAEALENLLSDLQTARASMTAYENTLRQMPGLTVNLKRARRRVSASIGSLIAELSFSVDKAETMLNRL